MTTTNQQPDPGAVRADTIPLSRICEDASWHRQTSIDALIALGMSYQRASNFVDFAFCEKASRYSRPEDCVTDEEYEWLEYGRNDWTIARAALEIDK